MTAAARLDLRAVEESARSLSAVIEELFAPLVALAARLEESWRVTGGAGLTTGELTALEPAIFDSLDAVPEFDGAGYVMAVGALADRERYLEWWHRSDHALYQPLVLNLDPTSPDHYDYDTMEWFVAGRVEGRRFVSGPLIDLPCAESHIMTFSQPVIVDGRFVGVAGADVAMSRLEARLVPPIRRLGGPAVLVNAHRRVIAAGDARWAAGDKLKTVPEPGEWGATCPVTPDQGWVLAARA
jgi:hypothetical protein